MNADDFGRTDGVNEGIRRAHEEGIVTSATMMVRWPAAEAAASYARRRRSLAVGLHVDVAEWEFSDVGWRSRYQVAPLDDADTLAEELRRQLHRFRDLMGTDPTHVDSHQHVHREEPLRSLVVALGEDLGVPVRDHTPGIAYSGRFYGQDGKGNSYPEWITVDALVTVIEELPAGVTELGCHPGVRGDLHSVYADERALEVDALCNPSVRAALDRCEIELASFADLVNRFGTGRPGGDAAT